MPNELPTPDFYDYPWRPIDAARIAGRFVVVEWADGTSLEAFDWWLSLIHI